jgi:hypothetical protein
MINSILSIFRDSSGTFDGQEAGENIILLLRHHPFNVLVRVGSFGIACLAPIIIGTVAFPYLSENNLVAVFLTLSSAFYMLLWIGIFYSLTLYTLDVMIITNKRIIDHDQHGLFNRSIAGLHLVRVQDVSVHTHGIMETFLKFGDIVIQSAGSEKKFIFPNISDPEKVKNTVMRLVSESIAQGPSERIF